ncbi:Actin-like protein arp9 (SWI/SNF complex component arp9) [Didymella keratinophila]|nr:Actin-like protein arp9 (SWI/SNF complex component arp9) [Didymella keratinophila]
MPPFKDDQIIVIAPGSETTLAQLGLPESFTPARVRIRSRMFPAEKEGEFEPYKIRRKQDKPAEKSVEQNGEAQGEAKPATDGDDEIIWQEDRVSEEGAIWPIQDGKITDWPCFFALISHVYNALNPPFHTAILLITQPSWTPREHEKLAQFFFEKFKTPAFGLMDAALATTWAYGVHTATIVDVGKGKTDVTAVSEFIPHLQGRIVSLPGSGGEAFTEALHDKLKSKGFNRDMCEQLKKSPICEILPEGTPLPGSGKAEEDPVTNPAAAASTGATGSGPAAAAAIGNAPRGPGPDTEVGEEDGPENEGVLDVASIVAGGKMNEYLAKKEKEKQDKSNARKKGAPVPEANKPVRLPNSKREKATFLYEDHALLDALKNTNLDTQGMADAKAALDEGPSKRAQEGENGNGVEANGGGEATSATSKGAIRREMEVGTERFLAGGNGTMEKIADAIHRAISSVDEVNKRSELWDSLIICGNGSRLRGFKEALLQTLNSKYLISPSSATIFTSEIPSNISTPAGTGANTPQPQLGPHGGSGVNPLLFAATTAQSQGMMQHGGNPLMPSLGSNAHSSHGQTPTSIKTVKPPEYFPEWKDVGFDESAFLGAQVAAKVIFVVDQGQSKGYMTRPDYNDQGPQGIHDYSL